MTRAKIALYGPVKWVKIKKINLKDKTLLRLFAKHPSIDIHIKFCVGTARV
jgi:hypothetical protein